MLDSSRKNKQIRNGVNTLLASESGSGKTLAFLLPILNRVFYEKDEIPLPREDNSKMFLNAEDLYYDRKYAAKKLSVQEKVAKSQMRGAIIVASSRELLSQIYSLIRRLDVHNSLNVNRVGSSVQLFSPIAEHITKEGEFRNKRELMTEQVDQVSVKNIINNAKWELNDIMLTTPMLLKFLIDDVSKYEQYDINPSVIALDEFDLLFNNPGMEASMLAIMRKFGGSSDKNFSKFNMRRQFILSCSTLPAQIQGKK